jgi:hypothetical protein
MAAISRVGQIPTVNEDSIHVSFLCIATRSSESAGIISNERFTLHNAVAIYVYFVVFWRTLITVLSCVVLVGVGEVDGVWPSCACVYIGETYSCIIDVFLSTGDIQRKFQQHVYFMFVEFC